MKRVVVTQISRIYQICELLYVRRIENGCQAKIPWKNQLKAERSGYPNSSLKSSAFELSEGDQGQKCMAGSVVRL
jgi:hypothetical protein